MLDTTSSGGRSQLIDGGRNVTRVASIHHSLTSLLLHAILAAGKVFVSRKQIELLRL